MVKEIKLPETSLTVFLKNLVLWFSLLALLTPLVFSMEMYFPYNAPRALYFMAMVQIVFFAWLLLAFYNKNYRPRINSISIAMFLYIGAMALSTVFSADSSLSFWSNHERMMGLLMHLHLFAFFLVLSSTFRKEKDWSIFIGFSILIASIVSLIGIADNFEILSFKTDFARGSTLGNTSFMGTYLLINVFLALYLFLREKRSWKTFYAVNFMAISLGLILNPGGRAMKGAFFIGFVVFFFLYLAFVQRGKAIRKVAKTVIVLSVISCAILGLMVFQEGSFVRNEVESLYGMHGRLAVWEKAWLGFMEKPLLGWGPESFDLIFLKNFNPKMFLEDYGREVWFDRAHNTVFDSIATTGVLGTITFFGLFGTALFVLWKRFLRDDKIDFLAPLVFSSLFVAHFIQNLTVFDMVSSAVLLFLILAFISSICYGEESRVPEGRFKYASLLVLIPFVFSLVFFVVQPYKGNILIASSIQISQTSEEKMELTRKAIDASPLGREQIRRHIGERFLARHKKEIQLIEEAIAEAETITERMELEKNLAERKELLAQKFEFVMEEMEKAIEASPLNFRILWLMGKTYNDYFDFFYLDQLTEIYVKGGDSSEEENLFREAEIFVEQSKRYFEKAIETSPRNQQGYWNYAQAIINEGKIQLLRGNQEAAEKKFQEALDITKKVIDLEPELIDPYFFALRVAKELLKDEDSAEEITGRALEINPSWEKHF